MNWTIKLFLQISEGVMFSDRIQNRSGQNPNSKINLMLKQRGDLASGPFVYGPHSYGP